MSEVWERFGLRDVLVSNWGVTHCPQLRFYCVCLNSECMGSVINRPVAVKPKTYLMKLHHSSPSSP